MGTVELTAQTAWLAEAIRQATQTDLAALEWEGAFIHFRRVYARAFQRAQLGDALLWVVERAPGFLIAQLFVLLKSEKEPAVADGRQRAFIHSFRVRPEFRSRGLGSGLLKHAELDLLERGFRWAYLHVADENTAAVRFYERSGYRRVFPVPGDWSYEDHLGMERHVHEPGWRMRKSLTEE
ncbi:MAG: GNAT family N-acetyltransferase [Chloroflexi bacterium]|nr:GNAT family N-acetyltransferase [Chloroflexota bacterium]